MEPFSLRSKLPPHELPREKLFQQGPQALSDMELLALLLRVGSPHTKENVLAQAQRLLTELGGLRGLTRLTPVEFSRLAGVGPVKGATIAAAIELGRRRSQLRWEPGRVIRSADQLYRLFKDRFSGSMREAFVVVCLDQRRRVLSSETISVGTLTGSLIHPREAFRPAIQRVAAAVAFIHNHPSGDPRPSFEDRAVTFRLRESGEILGIRVLDHLIIAEGGFYSFAENRWPT